MASVFAGGGGECTSRAGSPFVVSLSSARIQHLLGVRTGVFSSLVHLHAVHQSKRSGVSSLLISSSIHLGLNPNNLIITLRAHCLDTVTLRFHVPAYEFWGYTVQSITCTLLDVSFIIIYISINYRFL